jgi:two-component system OmpR family response regulator
MLMSLMRPTLLVVEDDPGTRTLLSVLMERCGLDADVVSNGNDAVTLLSRVRYAAVLTDLYVPGKSGAELLTFIQANSPELLRRSIVLSSAPQRVMDHMADFAGVRVMSKPFDLDELTDAVMSAVDGTAPQPPLGIAEEFCRRSVLSGAKAGVVLQAVDRSHLGIPISFGYPPGVINKFTLIDVDAPYPACEAFRSGRGVWLPSSALAGKDYPLLSTVWKENESFALAALPLVADGTVFGVAGWSFRTPRPFAVPERDRFEEIAAYLSHELAGGQPILPVS